MPESHTARVEILDLQLIDGSLRGVRERITTSFGELQIELSPGSMRSDFKWSVGQVLRFDQGPNVIAVRRPIDLGEASHVWTTKHANLGAALLPAGYTLSASEPQPIDVRLVDNRLAVFWAPKGSDVTFRLTRLRHDEVKESKRLRRRYSRRLADLHLPGIGIVSGSEPPPPSRRAPLAAVGVVALLAVGVLIFTKVREEGAASEPYAASHAVVIGVDDYASGQWGDLDLAVRDARQTAALLRRHGFQVHTLFNERATKRNILSLLEDDLAPRLEADDRVLVYFAGHGYTKNLGGEPRGYIVPYDGDDQAASYISMEALHELSGKMNNAKHQLFILDACFGGLMAERVASGSASQSARAMKRALGGTARQVLTAGGAVQFVPDRGLFTESLLRGIGEGLADDNSDGYVTASELARFVTRQADDEGPTPVYSTLPAHADGDFVFAIPFSDTFFLITPETTAMLLNAEQPIDSPKTRGPVYPRAAPAVVLVLSGNRRIGGHATGFLVDGQTVVTNHHVVADIWAIDADRPGFFVDLYFRRLIDGEMEPCHDEAVRGYITHVDSTQDLALLEHDGVPAECGEVKPLSLSESEARPEDPCAMIGHPMGGLSWSIRVGNVMNRGTSPTDLAERLAQRLGLSATQRTALARFETQHVQDIVMTDLTSNPGDSGGPLLTPDGSVLGVNCGISGGKFAYHVDVRHVRQLLEDRDRADVVRLPYVPDAHRFVTPRMQMHRSRRMLLSQPESGEPRRFLLDLDGDTPRALLSNPSPRDTEQLLVEHKFDAEVAIHRLDHRSLVFYDTDDTPGMDRILVYESSDGTLEHAVAAYELSRKPNEDWQIEAHPGNPWLDPSPIPKIHRDAFAEFVKPGSATGDLIR